MDDFIEDLFAFFAVTGEPITCSRRGRLLAEGEQYTLDEDNQAVCLDSLQLHQARFCGGSVWYPPSAGL